MEIPDFIIDGLRLKLKQVLFFYEIAVFFVCNNKKGELFLIYCSDIDNWDYSIVCVNQKKLIEMLDNKISIDEIFISAQRKWKVTVDDFDVPTEAIRVNSFSENMLPKKDAFFGKLDDDIRVFLDELRKGVDWEPQKNFFAKNFGQYFQILRKFTYDDLIDRVDVLEYQKIRKKYNREFSYA